MATTFTADSYAEPAWTHAGSGGGGGTIERISKAEDFTLSAVNDEIKFFKLPPNAKILGGFFMAEEVDTNATPTGTVELQVTDGTTTYKLIDGLSVGADVYQLAPNASTNIAWQGQITDDDDWYVQVELDTVCATFGSDVNIQVGIRYSLDREAGE
jgi:hypothetical protein